MNLLLVDTGAEISILKPGKISSNQIVNNNEKCTITGINNHTVDTFGTAITSIRINPQHEVMYKFQIVHQEFPIATDGILGRDFFTKFHCKIDYDAWILTGNADGEDFEIPIEDRMNGEFVLPPRCEVYRQIHVAADRDFVMPSLQIKPGIFCANSIINASTVIWGNIDQFLEYFINFSSENANVVTFIFLKQVLAPTAHDYVLYFGFQKNYLLT